MLAFHGFQSGQPARPGATNDLSIKPFSQGGAYIGVATIQNNYNVEDIDVTAVQLIFGNHETTARTISFAEVAFHYGLHTDGVTPLNSAGLPDNSLWQLITSATGLVNAAAGAGSSPNFNRSYTPTVWQPISSGGTGLRFMSVRVYGQITLYGLSGEFDAWSAIDQGRHLNSYYKFAVDGVSNPGSFVSGLTAASSVCPAIVRLRSRRRGLSLGAFGDSISQGYRTTSDHNSFGFKAACLGSTSWIPVTFSNFGVAGTTSLNFYQEACTVIGSTFPPSVVCFPVFSPNDNSTLQTDLDAMWTRALDIVSRCQTAGTVPVLWGPTPYYVNQPSQSQVRGQRDRAKTYCAANGIFFVDMYAALENPAVPDTMLPAYDFGDHHPNDAGTTAMGAELYRVVVQPLLAAMQ